MLRMNFMLNVKRNIQHFKVITLMNNIVTNTPVISKINNINYSNVNKNEIVVIFDNKVEHILTLQKGMTRKELIKTIEGFITRLSCDDNLIVSKKLIGEVNEPNT